MSDDKHRCGVWRRVGSNGQGEWTRSGWDLTHFVHLWPINTTQRFMRRPIVEDTWTTGQPWIQDNWQRYSVPESPWQLYLKGRQSTALANKLRKGTVVVGRMQSGTLSIKLNGTVVAYLIQR